MELVMVICILYFRIRIINLNGIECAQPKPVNIEYIDDGVSGAFSF